MRAHRLIHFASTLALTGPIWAGLKGRKKIRRQAILANFAKQRPKVSVLVSRRRQLEFRLRVGSDGLRPSMARLLDL
jgi:hypothetical protein